MAAKTQNGCYVLVAFDTAAADGVVNPTDGLHFLAAFLLFGAIQNQLNYVAFLRIQQGQQLVGFPLQQHGIVASAHVQEVVEPAAMRLTAAVQMAVQRGNIPPTPGDDDQQNEGAEVLKMVPVERIFKGIEKRFQLLGKTDDLKHNGNLLSKRSCSNPFIEENAVFVEKIVMFAQNPILKVSQLEN